MYLAARHEPKPESNHEDPAMLQREIFALLVGFIIVASAVPASSEILKQEPPMGQLREGQRVLVDDGSCPSGQIKEVVGGNHVKVGGTKHIERTHRCIPR
jgi:hypothetical protein